VPLPGIAWIASLTTEKQLRCELILDKLSSRLNAAVLQRVQMFAQQHQRRFIPLYVIKNQLYGSANGSYQYVRVMEFITDLNSTVDCIVNFYSIISPSDSFRHEHLLSYLNATATCLPEFLSCITRNYYPTVP